MSEYGDFNRFADPNKMLSFAGLEPGYFQSGTTEYKGRMVKRGSSHLRNALMNCARAIRLHNETFATYFSKKMNEGKSYNVATNHVAKKLGCVPLTKTHLYGLIFRHFRSLLPRVPLGTQPAPHSDAGSEAPETGKKTLVPNLHFLIVGTHPKTLHTNTSPP